MNDYWNDPPDDSIETQCPKCQEWATGEYLRDNETGTVFECMECNHQWTEPFPKEVDIELYLDTEEMLSDEPNQKPFCPHNNKWEECDSCYNLGDLNYDANRESNFFRR